MLNKHKHKGKSLNRSYNKRYNRSLNTWKEELTAQLDRKKAEVTFDPYLFDGKEYWNLDLDKIEETVRTGKIFDQKCEKPNKICFKRYPQKCITFLGHKENPEDFRVQKIQRIFSHQKFVGFFSALARKILLTL